MSRLSSYMDVRAKADINPEGTSVSGYSPESAGPFRCDHCVHYSEDACNHPVVMADPGVPKNDHGDAIVDDGACCFYFRQKGAL